MRPQWYSDKRDLIKWSTVLHLARKHQADTILQIAYFRDSDFPAIQIGHQRVAIPPEVLAHFRNVDSVARMTERPAIKVFGLAFQERRDYHKQAADFVRQSRQGRTIVLLDPDTGLAPAKVKLEHVTPDEVRTIFSKLCSGDILVLYQHQTNRNGKPWIAPKRRQFADAIRVKVSNVGTATGTEVSRDVAFFFAEKPSGQPQTD